MGIVYIGRGLVDKTALFVEGYARFPTIAVQFVSPETGEEVTTVATSQKDLNLVEFFGLKSGAPFRVTIGPDRRIGHEAQALYIRKAFEDE